MCSNKTRIFLGLTVASGLVFSLLCVLTAMNSRYYQINYNSSVAEVVNYNVTKENCSYYYQEFPYTGYIIFDYRVWFNDSYSVCLGTKKVSCGNYSSSFSKVKRDYPLNSTFDIFYQITNPNNWLRHNYTFLYFTGAGVGLALFLISSALFMYEQCFRNKNEYKIIN